MDEAKRLYNKEWRAKNREKMRQKSKDYYDANKEKVSQTSAAWAKANTNRVKSNNLKRTYGIDLVEFNTMLERQHYSCAICAATLDGGRDTHVDHCHESGRVRGLLCGKCNMALGLFQERSQLLERAAAYLQLYEREIGGVPGIRTTV